MGFGAAILYGTENTFEARDLERGKGSSRNVSIH